MDHCLETMKVKSDQINTIAQSVCARLIIHIIGDIHQPLHTSALFSNQFPNGDLGGNKFDIVYTGKKKLNNLHSFWDSTAHKYNEVKAPLDESKFDRLQVIAEEVTTDYPRSHFSTELKRKTFDEWVDEIGHKARTDAYGDLSFPTGSTLTEEYVAKAQETVKSEMALGGYRLADWLVQNLGFGEEADLVSQ